MKRRDDDYETQDRPKLAVDVFGASRLRHLECGRDIFGRVR